METKYKEVDVRMLPKLNVIGQLDSSITRGDLIIGGNGIITFSTFTNKDIPNCYAHHLYFVEGGIIHKGEIAVDITALGYRLIKADADILARFGFLKVVASTNPNLGLPVIPYSFVQLWVKTQGKIKGVKLEMIQAFSNEACAKEHNEDLWQIATTKEWNEVIPILDRGYCSITSATEQADQLTLEIEHVSFIELCIQGKATEDQVDDYIDIWHNDIGGKISMSLCQYLGMTSNEYDLFVLQPEKLNQIIESHRKEKLQGGKTIEEVTIEMIKSGQKPLIMGCRFSYDQIIEIKAILDEEIKNTLSEVEKDYIKEWYSTSILTKCAPEIFKKLEEKKERQDEIIKTIRDKNILIAKYMGAVSSTRKLYLGGTCDTMIYKEKPEYQETFAFDVDGLKYHSDWNWLMEVVAKIESQSTNVAFSNNLVYIENSKGFDWYGGKTDDSKLISLWYGVIAYVKWYNAYQECNASSFNITIPENVTTFSLVGMPEPFYSDKDTFKVVTKCPKCDEKAEILPGNTICDKCVAELYDDNK